MKFLKFKIKNLTFVLLQVLKWSLNSAIFDLYFKKLPFLHLFHVSENLVTSYEYKFLRNMPKKLICLLNSILLKVAIFKNIFSGLYKNNYSCTESSRSSISLKNIFDFKTKICFKLG